MVAFIEERTVDFIGYVSVSQRNLLLVEQLRWVSLPVVIHVLPPSAGRLIRLDRALHISI